MKSLNILTEQSQKAIDHIYEVGETYLYGEMGSGKTVTILAAIHELLQDSVVKRVLVVSTAKIVRNVWPSEPGRWQELDYLTGQVASVTGALSEKARRDVIMDASKRIVCINFEMLPWFFTTYGKAHGFDMLVIDEVTKLKAGGAQFKKLRPRIHDFTVRVVATGTPVEENWQGVFYPMMIVDGGKALGRTRSKFLFRYFFPIDYEQRQWQLQPHGGKEIMKAIRGHIVSLPDYTHTLPPLHEQTVLVTLPTEALDYYNQLKRDMINDDVVADSAAVLQGKLQQVAGGFIYAEKTGERVVKRLHDAKEAALTDLVSFCGRGEKMVLAYQFDEELAMLQRMLAGRCLVLKSGNDVETLEQWRDGDKPFLIVHPKSAGHGLDMTAAFRLALVSPIWSRDQTRQLIQRIWRRPQAKECIVYTLCALGTVDELIMQRVDDKGEHHKLFKAHLRGD